MNLETSILMRIAFFVVATIALTALSWRSLHNPKSHGFYRFFAFEAIVVLILLNVPFWFKDPLAPLQIVSWIVLTGSIFFVFSGFYLLRTMGGRDPHIHTDETFKFEQTEHLVTAGVYRYIRHPLYSALLLLAWGAFFKRITLFSTLAVVLATIALIATAKAEEKENLESFGDEYAAYIKKTKMFIPFVF